MWNSGLASKDPSGKPGAISKLWTIIARSLLPFSVCWKYLGLDESYGGHSAKTGNSQAIDVFPVFFTITSAPGCTGANSLTQTNPPDAVPEIGLIGGLLPQP